MKKKSKRTEWLKIRCSHAEITRIRAYAQQLNLPTSTYCREQALNKKLPSSRMLDSEERELLKMFSKYEFNFIRISNMMKEFRPDLYVEIQALIQDMKMIIKEYFYDSET